MKRLFNRGKIRLHGLLRWSEKYTKTDMLYLAKGGFWLTSGEVISAVFVLILAVAFANLVPKETYGAYKFILAGVAILSIFTLKGTSKALVQSIARGYEKSVQTILKTKIRWGLTGSFFSLCAAFYYYFNGNMELAAAFVIASFFIPFLDTFMIFNAVLNGRKNFRSSTIYGVVGQLVFVITMAGVLFLTQNLFVILLTFLITWSLIRIISYYLVIRTEPLNDKEDTGVVSYGKHLSFMGVLAPIAANIDQILLWHFIGPVGLATYLFALAPVRAFEGPINSISALALPKMSVRGIERLKETLPQKMGVFFIVLVPLVIAYILAAPFLYKIFFPQYLGSVIYSQVFALILLLSPKLLLGGTLFAHKKTKELYIAQFGIPIIRITLFLALLPFYGIWGAIVALLLSAVISTTMNAFLLYRTSS